MSRPLSISVLIMSDKSRRNYGMEIDDEERFENGPEVAE